MAPTTNFAWAAAQSGTHALGCVLSPSHLHLTACLVHSAPPPVPVPFATPAVSPVPLSAPGPHADAHASLDCPHGAAGAACACHTRPIGFYDAGAPYYQFTNFSAHPVHFRGLLYPTAEHLFQAHKFLDTRPDVAERLRRCGSARAARALAAELRALARPDWPDARVRAMDAVLAHKFAQHPDLAQLLKWTGRRELREESPTDGFWGVGKDGGGRNELGKALMRLRDRL